MKLCKSLICILTAVLLCGYLGCAADGGETSDASSAEETVAVTDISVKGAYTVAAGSAITLTAEVVPANATNKTVTWSVTSGGDCASVSSIGVVTGKTAGSSVVMAMAGTVSVKRTITVTAAASTGGNDSGNTSGSTATDGSENNTVTAGATNGTSMTGTSLTYTASDTTWDTLVWSDEFEGTGLKAANWVYETGAGGWGNSELETYTSGGNATVAGGVLDICAKGDLTSTRIKSAGLKTFKYGRIESRLKCDQGVGSWPAFWMLGTSSSQWPYQGEIDIMEHANSDAFTYQTCHWNSSGTSTSTNYNHASYGGTTNNNYYNKIDSMDISEWHTYAIEWTSSVITFFVDHTKVMEIGIGGSDNGLDTFNYPFYIIYNFAMGGQFTGIYNKSAFTNLPWHMYVDYVRVYQ